MSVDNLSTEELKDAVLATTRALAQDPTIKQDFSNSHITDSDFVLPPPPQEKAKLASYR